MRLDPMLPAPPMGPRIDFWTPINKAPEPVLILSSRVYAHFIHYDRRTMPCLLETDELGNVTVECELCRKGELPRRWKGYLHVYRLASGLTAFLCLPQGTGSLLREQNGEDFNYRGLMANVHRFAGAKNKPLVFAINQHAPRRTEVPEELDPTPFLETVFRMKKRLPTG